MTNKTSPGRNLRILFLTPAMGVGGVGRQLFELSTALKSRGHEIKIISLTPIGKFGQKTQSSGVPVKSLNFRRKILAPLAVLRVRREIKSFKPDVLHAHSYHAIIMGRLACIGLETATISTIHNVHNQNPVTKKRRDDTTLRDRVYSITDRFTDITTFVSNESKNRYVRASAVPGNKSIKVYNGINVEQFSPSPPAEDVSDNFIWITVGSLERRKDHRTLLEAIDILCNKEKNFTVWFIGEGRLREKLERTTAALEIEDFVEFKGEMYDIPGQLNKSDAFVLPSQSEGFGLVVAEAMACGLPVVSTNSGGPTEIVVDGETGILVSKGDPQSLADSMAKIMKMPDENRSELGSKGRKRIENQFSINQIVSRWERVYCDFTN